MSVSCSVCVCVCFFLNLVCVVEFVFVNFCLCGCGHIIELVLPILMMVVIVSPGVFKRFNRWWHHFRKLLYVGFTGFVWFNQMVTVEKLVFARTHHCLSLFFLEIIDKL